MKRLSVKWEAAFFYALLQHQVQALLLGYYLLKKPPIMKNLNSRELVNHLYTSCRETLPDYTSPTTESRKAATIGEYSSRAHNASGNLLRSDRNFTQSLWGRR